MFALWWCVGVWYGEFDLVSVGGVGRSLECGGWGVSVLRPGCGDWRIRG